MFSWLSCWLFSSCLSHIIFDFEVVSSVHWPWSLWYMQHILRSTCQCFILFNSHNLNCKPLVYSPSIHWFYTIFLRTLPGSKGSSRRVTPGMLWGNPCVSLSQFLEFIQMNLTWTRFLHTDCREYSIWSIWLHACARHGSSLIPLAEWLEHSRSWGGRWLVAKFDSSSFRKLEKFLILTTLTNSDFINVGRLGISRGNSKTWGWNLTAVILELSKIMVTIASTRPFATFVGWKEETSAFGLGVGGVLLNLLLRCFKSREQCEHVRI